MSVSRPVRSLLEVYPPYDTQGRSNSSELAGMPDLLRPIIIFSILQASSVAPCSGESHSYPKESFHRKVR